MLIQCIIWFHTNIWKNKIEDAFITKAYLARCILQINAYIGKRNAYSFRYETNFNTLHSTDQLRNYTFQPSNADKGGLYLIVVIKNCSGKYIPVPGLVFLVQHVDIDDPPYPDTPAP